VKRLDLFLTLALLFSGCSLNTYIPANRFDLPETHGRWLWGRIQLRHQGTTRVELIPSYATTPPVVDTPKLEPEGLTLLNTAFNVESGIAKKWDLFLRMPVAPAPNVLGIKYQILGNPYDQRAKGDWALAFTLAGGVTRLEADRETGGLQSKISILSWLGDVALVGGHRPLKDLMIYGGPFYGFHTSEGDINQLNVIHGVSGRGSQFGFNLGGAYSINATSILLELAIVDIHWSYSTALTRAYLGLALSQEF
jgi:hypothetical protein